MGTEKQSGVWEVSGLNLTRKFDLLSDVICLLLNCTLSEWKNIVEQSFLDIYTILWCFQTQITMKVIQGLYSGVTTVELDTLAAETAATLTTKYPDYAILAARIAVSNLHKETKKVFSGE